MTSDSSPGGRLDRALASLRGLAVGDALGSRFFVPVNYPLLKRRELPSGPWRWTDDTEMASSVVAVLARHRRIDQDALAGPFARHPDVGPGHRPGGHRLVGQVPRGGRLAGAGVRPLQGTGLVGQRRRDADRPPGRLV